MTRIMLQNITRGHAGKRCGHEPVVEGGGGARFSEDEIAARPMELAFDGAVCFGDSDWWYHNRGHYDMQMMRQLSQHVPVLYVNSIGVRTPRLGEGRMFLRRVSRKLKSLSRGLVTVQENFSVFSPVVPPGRMGMLISRQLMVPQIRWAMRRLGIHRPLIWVACPTAARIVSECVRRS